jgi:predicted metallopeptidase
MNKLLEISNEESPEVFNLAKTVISEENLTLEPAKIGYLIVSPNISKTVAARCIKTNKELKFFSGYDYLIEVSGELWDVLDESIKKILLLHELLHVGFGYDKLGNLKFQIRNHNVEDFSYIIKKYGIDWFTKVNELTKSLYDLDESVERIEI